MWPATRGPSLEEESRCQTIGMLPLEKECGQLSSTWQQPLAHMQGLALRAASLDEESLAWDPSQWQLDPAPPVSQEKQNLVNFVNDNQIGMADFVVQPVSRLDPWPVNWEAFLQPGTVPEAQSGFVFPSQQMPAPGNAQWYAGQAGPSAACPTSQNLAEWDAMNEMSGESDPLLEKLLNSMDPLLEKFMKTKKVSGKRGSAVACDASDSTAASSLDGDVVRELLLPKGILDEATHNSESDSSPLCMPVIVDDQAPLTNVPDDTLGMYSCHQADVQPGDTSATLAINLTYSLGMWSIGSAKHATGDCKPCGFLWKKGCHKAQNCEFCHLCPADEVKKRKRDKIATRQREEMEKMWDCGDEADRSAHQEPRVLPPLPK